MRNYSFTWAVRIGRREATINLEFTDCEIGELDKDGQVTKGVWGMSWR